MNKKIILIIASIILIIIAFISILTYIFMKNGNNMSNLKEDGIKDILNINGYNATLEIEVEANKNKTKYIVKQNVENGKSRQEVIEPSNITGVITEYDGKNLKVINNSLNLVKTYEDYEYVVDNSLWLNSFIKEYKDTPDSKKYKKNNEIVLEIKNKEENKYNAYKKLYIDINTGKPTKMLVQDINQKTRIYILYTEIEIF